MKSEKIWFNWRCPHCQRRNRVTFPFQFELPKYYSANWECEGCGKESKLEFNFRVNGWHTERKPPKLRKRKQEKKEIKKKQTPETEDSEVYKNDHGSHK